MPLCLYRDCRAEAAWPAPHPALPSTESLKGWLSMYREVSPELLLALMSVKLEPLQCCSDGRWRSTTKFFPALGVSKDNVDRLVSEGFAVKDADAIRLTERGTELLRGGICMSKRDREDVVPTLN